MTGDTVNVAFRLEPLTKIFPYPIIVSEETVRLVRARYPFALIGTVGLTGRSKPVTVYGLKPAGTRSRPSPRPHPHVPVARQ